MKFLIYLASQSPRRKEILKRLRLSFKVVKSGYHERMMKHLSPQDLVLEHASGKAFAAKGIQKARFVLGADTLVFHRGKYLGKPKSLKEAYRTISMLSGKAHFVYTGIVLLDLKMKRKYTGVAKTKVFFKKLSRMAIENYFQSVNPLDKAGSYAIQEGPKIVSRIEGSWSNVVGLPEELLKDMLAVIKDSERVLEPETRADFLTVEMCH